MMKRFPIVYIFISFLLTNCFVTATDTHVRSTELSNSSDTGTNSSTPAPTGSPSNVTSAPSNVTTAPSNTTTEPTNATSAPSSAPTSKNSTAAPTNVTSAPTTAPSNTTSAPTSKNITAAPSTLSPTTVSPVPQPTVAPTAQPHHHASIGKIIGKTFAWLILVGLSVLLFGAIMSNRYRIYYFLRGVWFTILQMDCTRTVINKLRLSRFNFFRGRNGEGELNTIIFDQGDPSEGLLLREES